MGAGRGAFGPVRTTLKSVAADPFHEPCIFFLDFCLLSSSMRFLGTERQAGFMHLFDTVCPRSITKALLFISALVVAGCSDGKPAMNPVRGKVLYKEAPAGGVLVTLTRVGADDIKSQASTGSTDDEGAFNISTGQDEGAPEGDYVVTFIWMQDASGKTKKPGTISMSSDTATVDKLKGRYSNRKQPGVPNVTIKKGVNQLEPFHLQ